MLTKHSCVLVHHDHHGDKWQGWCFVTDGGDLVFHNSGATCQEHHVRTPFPGARADFGPAALDTQTLPCWAVITTLTLEPLDTAVTAPGTPHSAGKLVENGYSHYFLVYLPQLVLQRQLGQVPVPVGGGDSGS